MTELYPPFREAAKHLEDLEEGTFLPMEWFESVFHAKRTEDAFGLERLKLDVYLLREKGIVLIGQTKDGKKGYRIGTDEDKVRISSKRCEQRIASTLRRQQHIFAATDTTKLAEETQQMMDHQIRGNAFLEAARRVTRRRDIPSPDILKRLKNGEDKS